MIHGDAPYDSGFLIFQEPPMPDAQCQCPMPYALCPMPYAQLPIPAITSKLVLQPLPSLLDCPIQLPITANLRENWGVPATQFLL